MYSNAGDIDASVGNYNINVNFTDGGGKGGCINNMKKEQDLIEFLKISARTKKDKLYNDDNYICLYEEEFAKRFYKKFNIEKKNLYILEPNLKWQTLQYLIEIIDKSIVEILKEDFIKDINIQQKNFGEEIVFKFKENELNVIKKEEYKKNNIDNKEQFRGAYSLTMNPEFYIIKFFGKLESILSGYEDIVKCAPTIVRSYIKTIKEKIEEEISKNHLTLLIKHPLKDYSIYIGFSGNTIIKENNDWQDVNYEIGKMFDTEVR
jgi:hypothetical protein